MIIVDRSWQSGDEERRTRRTTGPVIVVTVTVIVKVSANKTNIFSTIAFITCHGRQDAWQVGVTSKLTHKTCTVAAAGAQHGTILFSFWTSWGCNCWQNFSLIPFKILKIFRLIFGWLAKENPGSKWSVVYESLETPDTNNYRQQTCWTRNYVGSNGDSLYINLCNYVYTCFIFIIFTNLEISYSKTVLSVYKYVIIWYWWYL
jgi:hypothetical protein